MKLEQLMEGVPFTLVQGSLDTEIADIIYDSRKAAPGLLFVCIVGTQRDSHAFAADCAAKGVSALVIQHDIDLSAMPGVTVVKVENSRYAMALMSCNLFGNPARQMTVIGRDLEYLRHGDLPPHQTAEKREEHQECQNFADGRTENGVEDDAETRASVGRAPTMSVEPAI